MQWNNTTIADVELVFRREIVYVYLPIIYDKDIVVQWNDAGVLLFSFRGYQLIVRQYLLSSF
jgi:hypothetical protein